MSNFLYLFRGGFGEYNQLSAQERETNGKDWESWLNNLKEKGKLVDGLPLSQEGKVLGSGGELMTNGPFAEGAELVGGYMIVSAKDMEEAITLSEGNPHFKFGDGSVEIREIMGMDQVQ